MTWRGKREWSIPLLQKCYDETSTGYPGSIIFGWFGGSYNGNDYMIADVNIKPASTDPSDVTSCVGLFGAVFNGTLKNIVLYSTGWQSQRWKEITAATSRWYAIGGLAGRGGVKLHRRQRQSATARWQATPSKITHQSRPNGAQGWGGTGLGGLIGVCRYGPDRLFSGDQYLDLDSRDNDNVRVGGLVGSCQGSISSCYSGGNITVASTSTATDMNPNSYDPKGIYVGGVVGGIYMKPLQVGGRQGVNVGQSGQNLQNTLVNCYTYTQIPAASSNGYIEGLYAVGGSGELNRQAGDGKADHGWTNYENTYYLGSVVLAANDGPISLDRTDIKEEEVHSLTYDKMADTKNEDGLLKSLNNNGGKFSTVTTETDQGDSLDGRYSFGSDLSLLGKDYPFPTILTQSSDLVESKLANVHYGDWPLEGIRRPSGALPVNLDLSCRLFGGKRRSGLGGNLHFVRRGAGRKVVGGKCCAGNRLG